MYPEPQPAKGILALKRISNAAVARRLGKSQQWVSRVLNGYAPAPEVFRASLAELLGIPEEELFRPGSDSKHPGDDHLIGSVR